MVRKILVVLLIVLLLLTATLLVACETAGNPQPTATAKPATPKLDTTEPPIPTPLGGYPQISGSPTDSSYP
jgi:ABC-type oligopeptide transport system substrate-binding subunit